MNITLKNIDPVNATLTIAIVKEDYQPQIEKALNEIRKNSVIDGFRKGNAPKSRIQAMYGKSVLVDEVNKLVSGKLYDYIKENQLNVLGEPLPGKDEQKPLDFNKQEDYEFVFDLALAPEMNVQLTKDDKVPYYIIAVSDEMIEKQINSYKANYGNYDNNIESVEDKDMVKGTIIELNEDGTPKEGGIADDSAVLMPSFIKEETEKAKFTGAKVGDTIVFNPYKAYDGHETELSSFLKIKKEEAKDHQGNFSLTITEITRYHEAELNQELFDKIYEPGTVTSEEAFKEKVKENIAQQLAPESDYKFIVDAKQLLEDKAKDIQFPDAFLKRWLVESDPEKRTEESVEKDYPAILNDLKFQLIKENIVKENDIKVETEEVQQAALNATRAQFAQYGMSNIPDDLLQNYAQEMLKKEKTLRQLVDKVAEDKIIAVLKEKVTLEPKEVSVEEFQKLFE
ncbi:MAG: trigger factor [Candidatus Symbiothrix sp.]|jgi:trigger factor|nr:trigger factor [Candidatus Symbiothrix sp.]